MNIIIIIFRHSFLFISQHTFVIPSEEEEEKTKIDFKKRMSLFFICTKTLKHIHINVHN